MVNSNHPHNLRDLVFAVRPLCYNEAGRRSSGGFSGAAGDVPGDWGSSGVGQGRVPGREEGERGKQLFIALAGGAAERLQGTRVVSGL